MIQLISETDRAGIARMEDFVRLHPKGHFLQSPAWRLVKERWQWRGVLALRGGRVVGALSLLIRPLPLGASLLYGPRGPVCDPEDEATLKELLQGVRRVAEECGGCALLLDPDIPETDLAFRQQMEALGLSLRQAEDFDGLQPRFVFRLPLTGRTQEAVLAGFSSKTRYQVRLARRRGVEIRHWDGDGPVPEERLEQFSVLMEETGRRDHFLIRDSGYFRRLLDTLGRHARLYLALLEGEPIAGTIAIRYGDKTWYLYGASSNRHRDAMPNYLLQWEMICWAIEGSCRVYDFRGVSGDTRPEAPHYGLYRFKKGFGGDFTAFCGQYTQVYRPVVWGMARLGLWANRQWRALLRR